MIQIEKNKNISFGGKEPASAGATAGAWEKAPFSGNQCPTRKRHALFFERPSPSEVPTVTLSKYTRASGGGDWRQVKCERCCLSGRATGDWGASTGTSREGHKTPVARTVTRPYTSKALDTGHSFSCKSCQQGMPFESFPSAGAHAAAAAAGGAAQGSQHLATEADLRDLETCNMRLLDAISKGDYLTYSCLVSEDLTCFEPEGCGHLVKGIGFHKYYFDLWRNEDSRPATNTTMIEPHTRVIGDVAIVAYVRMVQNGHTTTRVEETRVWKRLASESALSKWQLVHFHRSKPANGYN